MATGRRPVIRAGQRVAILSAVLTVATIVCARAEDPCATAMSSAVLVGKDEPGEPLRVRGVVYKADGVTPAVGVIVYVYQTDITGLYARKRGDPPRLQAWMRTDEKGRYEFRTIRPGPYPNRTEAAHIHFQLWGPDLPPQYNADLLFEGDEFIKAGQRAESESAGKFGFIKAPVKGADGVFEATIDIRAKPEGDTFEDMILHGVKPCGVNPPVRD
jgi:hypothetical protein